MLELQSARQHHRLSLKVEPQQKAGKIVQSLGFVEEWTRFVSH